MTQKVINKEKRIEKLSEVKLVENISNKLAEFSRDKFCAKGSPSFM